jgi:hypothetical protein
VTKRIAYTLLTACTFGLLLSSSAFAQEKEPTDAEVIAKQGMVQKDVFRFVPTGKKISVYLLGGAHYDCTSWEAEVQTTKAPKHGTVEIAPTEQIVFYAKDSPQARCNGKKVQAHSVTYKSSGDYKGPDEFDLFVMWDNGTAQELHFKTSVR